MIRRPIASWLSRAKPVILIPLGTRAGRAARARYTDQIFTDAEVAGRLAAASHRRIAEHFSAERMVSRHVELYSEELPA